MDLSEIINSKIALTTISALGGALLQSLFTMWRSRIREIPYTVSHERIGVTTSDPLFGEVVVTWNNQTAENLFTSQLTLTNDTSHDFENLKVKLYTGNETLLLTERTEIVNTSQIVQWDPEFRDLLKIPSDQSEPTAQQFEIYRHTREYLIQIFNRGESAVFRYMTTSVNGATAPAIWLDIRRAGFKSKYVEHTAHVHGVPQKFAIWLGLTATLLIVVTTAIFVSASWLIALISGIAGLFAQSIGAALFRALKFFMKLLIQ